MEVIVHDAKREHVNPERASQQFEPITNPLPSMFVISSRDRVLAIKHRSPDRPLAAMQNRDFTRVKQVATIDSIHTLEGQAKNTHQAIVHPDFIKHCNLKLIFIQAQCSSCICLQLAFKISIRPEHRIHPVRNSS
jgi:hypothetical protein